ncbi:MULTISPECIES: hypothetical protein [Vibrio]|nr:MULTISPECIES: hypothetical protein [Vibrio]
MLIVKRLIKLAIICVVFFTLFDLLSYGEITWHLRLIQALSGR